MLFPTVYTCEGFLIPKHLYDKALDLYTEIIEEKQLFNEFEYSFEPEWREGKFCVFANDTSINLVRDNCKHSITDSFGPAVFVTEELDKPKIVSYKEFQRIFFRSRYNLWQNGCNAMGLKIFKTVGF